MGEPQRPEPCQPSDETAGSVPDSGSTGEAATAAPPSTPCRRLSRRVVLAIAVAVAVVLGAGAVIAFVAYDKATKLDRSTPAVALQQFLGAVFSDEDPARVSLFICSRWNAQDAIATIRSGINPTNTVSWGGLAGEGAGGRATVTGQMEVSDDQFADVQNWEFDNVDENGWRVCGAHQTS